MVRGLFLLCHLFLFVGYSVGESFEGSYSLAMGAVTEGEYDRASFLLNEVRSRSLEAGFSELPYFSMQLLKRARALEGKRGDYEVKFLVSYAILLSPKRPDVLIASSGFFYVLGYKKAIELFFKGVCSLLYYPSFVFSILRNLFFIVLIGVSLSFFIVLVFKLIIYRVILLRGLSLNIYFPIKGIFGPIVFLLFLVVPLFFAPLLTSSIWALLLSKYVKDCRYLGVFSGVLFMLWVSFIGVVENLDVSLKSPIVKISENIKNNSYVLNANKQLEKMAKKNPNDDYINYTYALSLLKTKNYKEAKNYFSKVLINTSSPYYDLSKSNLALIEVFNNNYKEAKKLLLSSHNNSADKFFLLAQIYTALMDIENHDKYFTKANKIDSKRTSFLESKYGSKQIVFLETLSNRYLKLFNFIFRDFKLSFTKKSLIALGKTTSFSSLWFSFLFSFFVFFFAIFFSSSWNKEHIKNNRFLKTKNNKFSFIWVLIPCGYLIRGKSPLTSVLVLGVIISCFLAYISYPVNMINIYPYSILTKNFFLFLVAFLIALVSVLSYFFGDREIVKR